MTTKEFLKFTLIAMLPVLVVIFAVPIVIAKLIENTTVILIIAIPISIILSFLAIKWIDFVNYKNWI